MTLEYSFNFVSCKVKSDKKLGKLNTLKKFATVSKIKTKIQWQKMRLVRVFTRTNYYSATTIIIIFVMLNLPRIV